MWGIANAEHEHVVLIHSSRHESWTFTISVVCHACRRRRSLLSIPHATSAIPRISFSYPLWIQESRLSSNSSLCLPMFLFHSISPGFTKFSMPCLHITWPRNVACLLRIDVIHQDSFVSRYFQSLFIGHLFSVRYSLHLSYKTTFRQHWGH